MAKKQIAYINRKMLMWARENSIFESAFDVASNLGDISAEDILKWENEEDYPSITQVKKLAVIYDVPFASFYLSDEPKSSMPQYVDKRTINNGEINRMSLQLWKEIRRMIARRENMLECNEDFLNNFDALSDVFAVDDNIDIIAQKIRDYFGISSPYRYKSEYDNNAFAFFREKIEEKGVIVMQLTGISLDEIRGLSLYFEKYPIIAINNKDTPNAKVFSLFHELAHIVRRTSALCTIDIKNQSDNEESICDNIAANVLVPIESFKDIIGCVEVWNTQKLYQIACKYGVSNLVVLKRLYDLSKITSTEYSELYHQCMEEFQIYQNRKNTPKIQYHIRYVSESGKLFPNVIIDAQASGKITVGEACIMLGVNVQHFGNIERMVMY